MDGVCAIMKVMVQSIQNERIASLKWLQKHSDEELEKARHHNANNNAKFSDDDDDDDDDHGDGGDGGDHENDGDDESIGGDDDEDDDIAIGDEKDDEHDSPLNKIDTAGALIAFLDACPIDILNGSGVLSLISKEDLERCVQTAQQVLDRDGELHMTFELEEQERAAEMENRSQNQNVKEIICV